jgi:amidase
MRPTHGRVPLDGVMPFAPSLAAVGWFARDPGLMRRIGAVLLDSPPAGAMTAPGKFMVAADAFAVVDPKIRAALAPAVARVEALLGTAEEVQMAGGDDLGEWSKLIAVYREGEGWRSHRNWIERCKPTLSDNGAMRMKIGAEISDAAIAAADTAREAVRARMATLLADGAVLAVPAAPGVAPELGGNQEAIWRIVRKNAHINAVSPLAGLPQISLPLATADGLPIGLGLMAAAGGDEMLLAITEELAARRPA